MRVVGMISGTSFDAIDVAIADLGTNGNGSLGLVPLGSSTIAFDPALRRRVATVLPPASVTLEEVCQLDVALGQAFADAARRAVEVLADESADLIVSHGQTVYHWVDQRTARGTLQLGQPAIVAEVTGLPVLSNVRSRDIAAGGHGAPLASTFDVLLLKDRSDVPVALNLGGIANITIAPIDGEPIAYDTGPANALIDAAVSHVTDGERDVDVDGSRAAAGRIDEQLLDLLLDDTYFGLEPPKSTGKEHFNRDYLLERLDLRDGHIDADDLVATATALTARTVALECRRHGATEVIAAGGGTRNPTLMRWLADELGGVPLTSIDRLGVPSAAKEAYAFCVIGYLSAHGLPGVVPSATGSRVARVLGDLTPGAQPLRLPEPSPAWPARLRIVGEEPAR